MRQKSVKETQQRFRDDERNQVIELSNGAKALKLCLCDRASKQATIYKLHNQQSKSMKISLLSF